MQHDTAGRLLVRPESIRDHESIRRLNSLAFPTTVEAELVDRLRSEADPWLSLVADDGGEIVGHIAFSPVTVVGTDRSVTAWGLGPMAVLPARQRQGIGSRLIGAGLAECRRLSLPAVFVLGHADYYPRFGFQPAVSHGLCYKGPESDPYFFVRQNRPGGLEGLSGRVEYHPAFDTA